MATSKLIPALLMASALAFSLGACGEKEPSTVKPQSSSPGPSPAPTQADADEEILALTTMGGECAEGACPEELIVIKRNGAWSYELGDERKDGQLTEAEVATMLELMEEADDSAERKSKPFCESWVDGRDLEIIFLEKSGEEGALSTCNYDLENVELLDFLSKTIQR